MKSLLICLMIFAAVLQACSRGGTEEEARLKVVVAKYNSALVEAYKSQLFDPLAEVAGKDEVGKVANIIYAYLQADQVMEAVLHSMDFKEINISEDRATVRTYEDWTYRWVNNKTGEEVEPSKDRHYEMFYQLERADDKWKVEKTEEIKGEGKEW